MMMSRSDKSSVKDYCVEDSMTEAGDGEEALDVMQRDEIHVALVDLHMPRLTGMEVIRRLAESGESPLAC